MVSNCGVPSGLYGLDEGGFFLEIARLMIFVIPTAIGYGFEVFRYLVDLLSA